MAKKKKQWLMLCVLSLAVIAMVAAYMLLPDANKEDEAGEAKTVKIASIAADSIESIKIQTDGNNIDLKMVDGEWSWIQKKNFPLNSEEIEKFVSALETVEAAQELDYQEDHLKDYGLQTPKLIVTVTQKDGKETVFNMGEAVPTLGGYYGTVNNNAGKLYAFQDSFYNTFKIDELKLYQRDEVPEMNKEYINGVTIDSGNGKLVFSATEVSEKEQIEDYSTWNITEPYKDTVAINPEKISTLQTAYAAINLGDLVEYEAMNLKQYGFSKQNKKVIVNYFELKKGASETTRKDVNGADTTYVKPKDRINKNLVLQIGKKADDNNYYVRLGESDNVYLMSSSEIISLTDLDPFEYADHCIYAVLATKIKGYDVTIGKTKIKVVRKEKDDKNIWYVNGKKIKDEDEEAFLTPYSALFLLEYSSTIKSDVKPTSDKPVMKIVYHANGRDIKVNYLPYDGVNFYRVEKEGEQLFLTNKRPVDDVISKFKEMLKLVK